MQPEPPGGPGPNRLVIVLGVVVVVGGYILWKRRSSASGTSATGATMAGTPYGPTPGFGSVVPVILQTPGAGSSVTTPDTGIPGVTDTSTTGTASGVTPTVPAPVPSTSSATGAMTTTPVKPAALKSTVPTFETTRVANPTMGSQLVAAKVPVFRSGNAWYFDPGSIVKIATPAQGSALYKKGYNVIRWGNSLYYNPNEQNIKPRP